MTQWALTSESVFHSIAGSTEFSGHWCRSCVENSECASTGVDWSARRTNCRSLPLYVNAVFALVTIDSAIPFKTVWCGQILT